MSDYQPLDLSRFCNAGLEVLEALGRASDETLDVSTGKLSIHGLPFLVGSVDGSNKNCFVVMDGSSGSLTIPVDQPATRLIIAHTLLESDLEKGVDPGNLVAEYVCHLSGGDEVRMPIRERFDVSAIMTYSGRTGPVGGAPFRAVPSASTELYPRYEGSCDKTGRRQTEVNTSGPSSFSSPFFLWTWKNPQHDNTIESIEIVTKGPRLLIAGITLGQLDEHPFVRQGKRPTKITLTNPEDAEKPFDLDVEVDRGLATYVHPLPEASSDEFINNPVKGWGEEQNTKSSPVYVDIAAIPSATVTLKTGEKELGKVNWGEVENKGSASTGRMRVDLLDRGRNWVHVTVLDDDTGKRVPCRIHLRSPEGVPYQPHGHHNQLNSNLDTWHIDVGGDLRLGQITYAYIDGSCQGWLPRGEVIVDIARGFEYDPLRTKVKIEPGQRELTLRIKRWINMNAQGWYSGDSHVHFLSTQGAHTESQGEDLNVVNLLQSQWGSLFTNTEEFTGEPSISDGGNNIVYALQENRQHMMGHMILWGLKKPVMPWCSDGPSEAELGGTMESTMSAWADHCHDQGGTVIIPHFPNPNGEPATLISTGRVDGVEMIRQTESSHMEYYRYLNCGYRLPLVGGTDKMSSDVPVGLYRTYARMSDGEEFNYDNWCKNVAKGNTFLSGGPIINLSVDGKQVGDTVKISGPGTVEVEAWAESTMPIHTLQIVQGGRVVASTESSNGTRRLKLKETIKVNGHTWLAARCGGPGYFNGSNYVDVWGRAMFAHTSPIYVACGGDWWMFNEETAEYMLTLIEGGLEYIHNTAALDKPGTVTHHHGEGDHMAFLERPFLQARQAVNSRKSRGK